VTFDYGYGLPNHDLDVILKGFFFNVSIVKIVHMTFVFEFIQDVLNHVMVYHIF
jgi:hypothetical protein